MTDDHQCALAPFTTTEEPPERISEYDTEGALEGEGGAGGAGVEKDDKLAPLLSHEEKKCQVTPEAIASLNYMRIFTPPRPRQRWIVNQNADHHKDHRPNHHTNQEHDAEQLGHLQEPSPAPPPGPQYLNTLSLSHEHRAAEPADLVLDLVFVVMLAGLGASFRAELFESEDASVGIAIRDFVAMFLPIWFQWNVINHYNNRFETHDMVNLVYFAGNFILSAVAGASSERCGSATSRKGCQEFAWAIAGARLWTVLFTFYAAYHNKRYSVAIFQYTVFDILVIILWMATSFMHSGEYCGSEVNKCWIPFIFLWWLTLLIDTCRLFLAPILSSKLKLVKNRLEMIPLDVSLLAERHELFIILSIGEVVVSALAGGVSGHSGDDEHHRRLQDGHTDDESGGGDDGGQNEYEMVIVIVCIAFAIKTWYFDLYGVLRLKHLMPRHCHSLSTIHVSDPSPYLRFKILPNRPARHALIVSTPCQCRPITASRGSSCTYP
mmetsp:Transcript_100241/g.286522  ORF Transcript_100241/g.286522 Transcript_100241/m.286522 type:complete len:493 (-) Transcript_100241:783-2261(-)